jgi:hypothetical protein
MPNQSNFRSDVTNQNSSRFLASRIVRFPTDQILFEEIPASFGYDNQDNVEFHFYAGKSNTLIESIVTKLSDETVKLHIVGYDDGTYKTYLQINFTKLFVDKNTTVVPGDYKVTINFFSDEIGSYDDRILTIAEISPSRTEIEVSFNDSFDDVAVVKNDILRREFLIESFTKTEAIGVMKKILKDGVDSNDDFEGLTANNVIKNIELQNIQTLESTISRLETMGIDGRFKQELNEYFPKLFENIREGIVIGDDRVQSDELETFIRKELTRTFQELQVSIDTRIALT